MTIRLAYLLVVLFLLLVLVAGAHAASVRVCFKDVHADAAEVRAYVGAPGVRVGGDLLPGTSQADGSICATISPIPAPIIPGTTQTWTLRAANAAGQESPPSNGLPFRLPNTPSAPTLLSIGATFP